MTKVATDFNKIILEGRERKKNEALAAKIFGKDNRRASAPGKGPAVGGSLASRVGVKKHTSLASRPARPAPGDVNAAWIHDLHGSRSTPNLRAQSQQAPKAGSLAARIHAPGTKPPVKSIPTGPRAANNNRTTRLANAVSRVSNTQVNVTQAPPAAPARGLTIRGLAGPFAVMAQNFAPGTTAADIESAMTPIGGIVQSCRLLKSQPIVIAEIVFESKEGADRVIETFNNQTADGRLLYVYHKPAGGPAFNPAPAPRSQRLNESRPGGNDVILDGSNGFDEPMETSTQGNSGLYSDRLVNRGGGNAGNNNNRRGRGFQNRGRGGR